MAKLSFEEFMKLSDKEKCIRYKDMNDYDRFRARVNLTITCGKSIGYIKLTKEQQIMGKEMIDELRNIILKSND